MIINFLFSPNLHRWFGSYNIGGQILFEEGMEDLLNGIVTNYHGKIKVGLTGCEAVYNFF
jgi:hypothetical protein